MPDKNKGEDVYQFKNWKHRMPIPYYFSADFECHVKNNAEKDTTGKTTKIQTHKPNSYKYVKIRYDGYSESPVEFIEKDADQRFVFAMIK